MAGGVSEFDAHERRLWSGRAAAYRDSWAGLCAHVAPVLLDAVPVSAGVRLLDVGTGVGTLAGLAVARGARVRAVDAEPGMVTMAAAAVPAAEMCQAVLSELPYRDDTFDVVTANFVINHVGDPCRAVAELCRVARPGGHVAVSIWPSPPLPSQAAWGEIFAAAGLGRTPGMRLPTELDFPRTVAGLAGLAWSAGLVAVRAETVAWQHRTAPEAWWLGVASGIGTAGHVFLQQPAEVRARVRDQYERYVAKHRTADGLLCLPAAALWATGTAPGRTDTSG